MTLPSLYSERLDRLRIALSSLPSSLPRGSNICSLSAWTPSSGRMDQHGAECSVLNAYLEKAFGLCAIYPVSFRERGPGVESFVGIITHYLEGDYAEKLVLAKWVDDLIEAASMASPIPSTQTSAKRLSKPLVAQKRSNEWVDTTFEETTLPVSDKTGLYLKQLLCLELKVGDIPVTTSKGSDEEDVDELLAAFRSQLAGYARG
ncbi:hypothetical protein FRC12_023167 [Ceratobasidium sp. 428]|nr:hypothetical protein FRC12_023167 [Ceratobasidium sp. 428]